MKLRIGIILVFVSSLALAQDGGSLRIVPVTGLPAGSIIVSFDVLRTEATNTLAVEARDANGVAGFYTFDFVEGELRGRIAGSTALPVRFQDPGRAVPTERTIGGLTGASRYWEVAQTYSPVANEQFVTAVPLPERRFADVSSATNPEHPPESAGLAIRYVTTDVNQSILTQCILEPNLMRRSERMTPVSASWILAQGRPHLLVGLASDSGADPWPLFYRLYSPSMEMVYQTGLVSTIDPNRYPKPVAVDLTGDGEEEIVTFGNTRTGASIVVLQPGPGDSSGKRVLALNDCSQRMSGDDVIALQRELERRGFSVGPHRIDGWYGPDTRGAVVAFQRSAGLIVTGVVDEISWAALGFR